MKFAIVAFLMCCGVVLVAQESADKPAAAVSSELLSAMQQRQENEFRADVLERLQAIEQKKTPEDKQLEAKRTRESFRAMCAAQGLKFAGVTIKVQPREIVLQCR